MYERTNKFKRRGRGKKGRNDVRRERKKVRYNEKSWTKT